MKRGIASRQHPPQSARKPFPVPALRDAAPRPFWSVMIPTCNPRLDYLADTLGSVLAQDSGADDMQIEVVDDGSDRIDPEPWLRERFGDRIGFHRGRRRLGIGGSWNACIARARGRWVHLLHQDDLVRPGFYDRLKAGVERRPDAGAAFVFHHFIDERGRILRPCPMPDRPAGIVEDWIEHVFVNLKFQCPAIVVRRAVYEHLGGFDEDYRYTLDWDMWQRIAVSFPIWYEPTSLALYREHRDQASVHHLASGDAMRETRRCIDGMADYLPESMLEDTMRRARANYAALAIKKAGYVVRKTGNVPAALALIVQAVRSSSGSGLLRAGAEAIGWRTANRLRRLPGVARARARLRGVR